MELNLKYQLSLVGVILLLPALCTSQDSFTYSRATYYGSPDYYGNPRGACGFGDYGRTVNNGSVAGVSRLWRNGSGCGTCYQVRCKTAQYCDGDGAYVVATDYGEGDRTDFIMSPTGYSRLGRNADASAELFKYGVVDVEYKRVPCRHAGDNVVIKIHEKSNYPQYLAIVVLYVSETIEVNGVEFLQEDFRWRPMRRAFGAVFDTENPPRGALGGRLIFRLQVIGSAGLYWVQSKNAIPSDWKVGATYDSEIQLD